MLFVQFRRHYQKWFVIPSLSVSFCRLSGSWYSSSYHRRHLEYVSRDTLVGKTVTCKVAVANYLH
jgi:hypothetical protein